MGEFHFTPLSREGRARAGDRGVGCGDWRVGLVFVNSRQPLAVATLLVVAAAAVASSFRVWSAVI